MMPSLFDRSDPHPLRTYEPLLDSLPQLGHRRGWSVLADLQSAYVQRSASYQADIDRLRPEVARRLEGSRRSGEVDVDTFLDGHLRWRQQVGLDLLYALAFGGDLESLVTFEGTEHVDEALARGAVVFVPFHVGSYMTVLPLLGLFTARCRRPLLALSGLSPEDGSKHLARVLPEMVMVSPTVLLELVRHIRRGGSTVFFPDVYIGIGAASSTFTQAGVEFLTSDSCSALAARTGATSIPVWVESKGVDGFVCHFGPGIDPPERRTDYAAHLQAMARVYDEQLIDQPWGWAGWSLATLGDRAVPSGSPRAR